MRVSRRRRAINLVAINKYKDAVRTVRKAIVANKKDEAVKTLSEAYKQLDRAAKKRVIHRNKSARLKSRLAHAIAKI